MRAGSLREAATMLRARVVVASQEKTVTEPSVKGVWLNSAYYLTLTPATSTAIAGLLDAVATRFDEICETVPTPEFGHRVASEHLTGYTEALAVADAILGPVTS